MRSITFDTLKFARRLKNAGVPEKHAEAEAEALAEVFETKLEDLVTQADLRDLETRLTGKMDHLEARLVGQLTLLKWMLALVIIVNVVPVLKVIFG